MRPSQSKAAIKAREKQQRYAAVHKPEIRARELATRISRKRAVFEHYAQGKPKCACCGEREYAFLTLDHVNDDGVYHRAHCGSGSALYYWLILNNFPDKPKLAVMCFNCNLGRRCNRGICPHKAKS